MGAADVVPGVSGGTIAVVLGIYERLLGAIRALAAAAGRLLRGDWRSCGPRLAAVDWWLIVPLLAGILATILLLASVIETQLVERPETMAGLFCGLVARRGGGGVPAVRVAGRGPADLDGGVSGRDVRPAGPAVRPGGRPFAAGAGRGRGGGGVRHDPARRLRCVPAADAGQCTGRSINVVTDLRYLEAVVFLAGAGGGAGPVLDRAGPAAGQGPQPGDGGSGGSDGRVVAGVVAVAQRCGRLSAATRTR